MHLFLLVYEESSPERRRGAGYAGYRQRDRRWSPRLPFKPKKNDRCRRAALVLVAAILLLPVSVHRADAQSCDAASALLDGNSVAAAVYNNGFLFWNGSGNTYRVPKESNANSIFNASLWIGGLVDGDLRVAATEYGPAEFRPGPLESTDCEAVNHIYKVTREDVRAYLSGGEATDDMTDWPWHLGAPVLDRDQNPDNYDLDAGDLPAIRGDQSIWWIMNDADVVGTFEDAPINMEVSVTASAVSASTFSSVYAQPFLMEALDHATFYEYRLRYMGTSPLEEAYVGFYVDVDLGDASDDYVGSDSLIGLAFAYNAEDFDRSSVGYGDRPPAIGLDFMRGMRAPADDGIDNDRDGVVDETGERIGMTAFLNLLKSGRFAIRDSEGVYHALRGRWPDGSSVTYGEEGYDGSTPTTFMFTGDPPNYWSMDDTDGNGQRLTPSDKRLVISMGPVDMQPGEVQDFMLAIVWARADDRLASVRKLKEADEVVQMAVDLGYLEPSYDWFEIPDSPSSAPTSYRFGLERNHPNPFSDETTVSYRVADEVHVRLSVYDVLGREVAVLVDEVRGAGRHTATFNAGGLSPGVYFVRMETLSQVVTMPVVLTR